MAIHAEIFLIPFLFVLSAPAAGETVHEAADAAFVLRVGCDSYEPYNYWDETGSCVGISADLAREACSRMGCRPEFVFLDWSRKDELLESGRIDCIWGAFTMTGAETRYRWAGPYGHSRQVLLVPATSSVKSLSDLKGRRVAVQTTGFAERFLEARSNASGWFRSLYSFPKMGNVMAALRQGYVDAVAGHEEVLWQYLPREEHQRYKVVPTPLATGRLGVAFSLKDDRGWDKRLDVALREMLQDGTVSRIMHQYHVKHP